MEHNLCDLDLACIRIEEHCLYGLTYVGRDGVICGAHTVCRNTYLEVFLNPFAVPCAECAACFGVAGLHLEVQSCRLCAVGCELCVCLNIAVRSGLCAGGDVCFLIVRRISAVCSCCGCGRIRAAAFVQNNLCDLNLARIRIEKHCLYSCANIRRNVVGYRAHTICWNAYLEVFLNPFTVPCAERAACFGVAGLHLEVQGCGLCAVGCELSVCLNVTVRSSLCAGGDVSSLSALRSSCGSSCCRLVIRFRCCSGCACRSLLGRYSSCDRTAADTFDARVYRTGLVNRVQTSSCADQTCVIVQGNFVCLIVVHRVGIGEIGVCRTADQRADQCMTVAAVAGLTTHLFIALITRCCSVVRILCRIALHAHNKVDILGVVAQDHAHLRLAPVGIIHTALCGILCGYQRSHLDCGVIPCAAPCIFTIISARIAALAVQISGDLYPIGNAAGDLTLENRCAQADIVPAHRRIYAPLAAGLTGLACVRVVHKLIQERAIGTVVGCQVQPTCRPCLIVIIVIRIVEVYCLRAVCLIGLDGIIVQCLRVLQILCVAKVDVVDSQCCGIFSSNVAGIVRCPVCSAQALVVLGLRRAPNIVVSLSYAHLIAEAGYRIAAQLCACLEVIAEAVSQRLEVCALT